ncbi:hypothetical protein Q3G72_034460 [Acer saccharum]|nr:hypothetical protein Q3G72_034460 [Acer saccharum]
MAIETAPLLVNRSTAERTTNGSGNCNGNGVEQQVKTLSVVKEFGYESKRLWKIAGPAIFTAICHYSLGALTQTFAGHVGELELAAVSVENSVIAGLAYGIMRSWVILLTTACVLVPLYVWSPSILELTGETTEISEAAGKFALWMLPQLFAYALNFPIQKFLQSQRKVLVIAWISAIVLVLHAVFSWLLILKLGWGLTGAAITLNTSWWLIVIGQLLYIFITKSDGAWSGFSWLAFSDLWGFVKLSLASAVMLCLEFWYLMVLVVITGRLSNPLIPVDAVSICMNIQGWDAMIAIGFNAAISVRVSNELGAGNSRAAKFAVLVVSVTSVCIGVIAMILVFTTRNEFPYFFTTSDAVAAETTTLAFLLAITVLLNCLQPVLSGVAVGAGWQATVAFINIGCYYIVGLPLGIFLGFTFAFGVEARPEETCTGTLTDFWIGDHWSSMFPQLRVVKIAGISGIRSELDFINFLLSNSPVLERLTVKPVSVDGGWDLMKELLRFRRASTRAEIIYSDP